MYNVYILVSVADPDRHYTGITNDLQKRLSRHNSGQVTHTSKFMPWRVQTYVCFDDQSKALAFEKYLKSGSGRAFAKKRL